MSEFDPSATVENLASDLIGGGAGTAEASPVELEEPTATKHAVLFELEHLAVSARQGTYETILGLLKGKGIDFDASIFNRFASYARPEHFVDDLLEMVNANKLSSSKLASEINTGLATYLATQPATLDSTLAKIIDTAREKDMVVAALTSLPKAVYSAFANKLGLDDRGVQIFSFTEADKFFPRADSWLKVCKEIEVIPRNSCSIVTTNVACKGALAAGMRVIALPDEYTSYQDFGGAYSVVDSLDDLDLEDVFSIMPEDS